MKLFIPYQHFVFDEGEVLIMGRKKDEWSIDVTVVTQECTRGFIAEVPCFSMMASVIKHIESDMALSTLLDEDYMFMDHFTKLQHESIEAYHDFLHEQINNND